MAPVAWGRGNTKATKVTREATEESRPTSS
jgi:hypothetical protein